MQGDFFLTQWAFLGMRWLYETLTNESIVLTILIATLIIKLLSVFGDIKSRKSTMKMQAIQPQIQKLQKKYENNAFISPERAQQEYNRLMKMQQDLQALQNKLTNELAAETQKNSLQLRDSINAFLKEYNKTKGYSLIISNTGFDNLLYADSIYNITREILDGLNARYSSPAKK